MITRDSTADYSNLFQTAVELLKEYNPTEYASVEINTMDDYFSHIHVLASIENGREGYQLDRYVDPIFTILPLDEDLFEINANTREIKVPEHFRKYGVGVQGDDVAEIIYFSIDRYFDAIDLMDMGIIIQWNRGGQDMNEYFDMPYKKSINYEAGKIVFGWPISKEMTDESGNIEFAVRFYDISRTSQNELVYSLSTKPATIKIEKSLDFTITQEVINKASNHSNKIYENLRDPGASLVPNYMIASPDFVSYATRSEEGEAFESMTQYLDYDLPRQFKVHANLSLEDLNKNKKKGLNGLTYQWYHKDRSGIETQCNSTFIYERAPAGEILNNEYYYFKDGENNYHLYHLSDGEQELYHKYSIAIPTAPGLYFAKAINSYNSNNKAEMKSEEMGIAYPENPVFINNYNRIYRMNTTGTNVLSILNENDQPVKKAMVYKWYYSETENINRIESKADSAEINLDAEGFYQFEAINQYNNGNASILSDIITVVYNPSGIVVPQEEQKVEFEEGLTFTVEPTYESNNGQGTLSYQWQKQKADDDWENIEGANENTLVVNSSGKYQCIIYNTYKEAQISKISGTFTAYTA